MLGDDRSAEGGASRFDGAAHGVDHATELDDATVAGALNHTPVMHGDSRVNQIAAERPQPRQCLVFVGTSKPAVSTSAAKIATSFRVSTTARLAAGTVPQSSGNRPIRQRCGTQPFD